MIRMITLLIITLIMSFLHKGKAADTVEPQGPVTYLSYSESGMRHRFEYTYRQAEDGTCTLSRKEGWNDNLQPRTFTVNPSVGDKLWKLVKKHEMYKYKSSYTPSMRILDGKSWHLEAAFTKGDKLYTGGENAWPSGDGIEDLEKYLDDIWATFPPEVDELKYRVHGSTMYPEWDVIIEWEYTTETFWMTNASNCERKDARKVQVPQSMIDQIGQIIIEEKMFDYKHEYNPPAMYTVYDGESWNLAISLKNCPRGIYSSGYAAWPSGYGLRRLEKLFEQTWEELKKKSVPAHLKNEY